MQHNVMDRVEDCVSFLIGKAAQQVSRRAREILAPHGVTPTQYAVLKVLSEEEGVSGADLGARIVLDSASVTGVIDRLVAQHLIERRADAKDRRVQRLHLTGKARAKLGSLDAAMDRLNAEFSSVISDAPRFIEGLRDLGERSNWKDHV